MMVDIPVALLYKACDNIQAYFTRTNAPDWLMDDCAVRFDLENLQFELVVTMQTHYRFSLRDQSSEQASDDE